MTVDHNFNTWMLSDQRINFFQQCDMNFYIFKMSRKKISYLNGLMEVFFDKFLRFSNLCRGFQPFATIFRVMEVFFAKFVRHFLKIRFEHVWSNPNTTLFWRIYMCRKRKYYNIATYVFSFLKCYQNICRNAKNYCWC
jgi:hypothetical protein